MSKYGMPYKGNKSKIVDKLIEVLPPAENFYDLFMGGGAVTHRALMTNKWHNFICNDLNPLVVTAWNMAMKGEFDDEKRWISRDDFQRLKQTDPYAAICFSFGNDLRSYAYGKDIEPWAFALHRARMFGDYQPLHAMGIRSDGNRFDIIRNYKEYLAKYCEMVGRKIKTDGKHFAELVSMERLQTLQRLKGLGKNQNTHSAIGDYRDVKIQADSVIYCDIPYKNTNEYKTVAKFDFNAFYDWCEKQTEKVFVSSYEMPLDRFDCIAEWKTVAKISATSTDSVVERLFVPKHQRERGCVGLFD